MGFFPAIGIICGFFALESLSGWAYQRSPKLLVSNDKIDRAFQSAEDSRALHDSGTAFWAGPIWVVSPKEIDQSLWKMKIASGVSFLSRKLSPVPLHPFVELRPIESAEGQFSGITMALDPQSEDPFRALFHELTHLYLLWALIPGFPVDCHRWFNEGMAEELAGQILEDYSGRWMNDLVLDSAVVTFDQLSPAFSWDNSFVELQGRHAFHKFLEKYEWEGVRRVISGLRQGRPFRSVFMLEFGVPVELFQSECLCDFVKSKVLSRIPRKLIVGKLRWLAGNRPPSEVLPLIRKSEILLGKIQELESLEREIYEKKIRQCLSIKHPNEALFWLSQIRRRHNHTSLVSLSKEVKDTAQFCENEIPRVQQFRERIYGFPHITAFILGYGLLSMYRRLRTAVKKWAWKAWHPDKESGLGFRWGMVAIFCLGWQWFIRFLLISGIPYYLGYALWGHCGGP
ncbi:hypothetical protein HYY75_06530 [bacterium]|nr:hypothetical protein [bacterium]